MFNQVPKIVKIESSSVETFVEKDDVEELEREIDFSDPVPFIERIPKSFYQDVVN